MRFGSLMARDHYDASIPFDILQKLIKTLNEERADRKYEPYEVGKVLELTFTYDYGKETTDALHEINWKIANHTNLNYKDLVKRGYQDILDEIQRLRLDKMFPSVVNDGMPHGSSHSDLSDYVAILDEQIDLLKEERLEKVRCYQKIERQISQMENEDEQEVLRLRYILGMKWEEVAVKMNYSWKWVHKIHGRALMNFKI